jgi:hypothetical protein
MHFEILEDAGGAVEPISIRLVLCCSFRNKTHAKERRKRYPEA